jgi:hypothetical protein
MQNLLILPKLLQGFSRGNVFPEKLKEAANQRTRIAWAGAKQLK